MADFRYQSPMGKVKLDQWEVTMSGTFAYQSPMGKVKLTDHLLISQLK